MANIVKKDGGQKGRELQRESFQRDPFQVMRQMLADPFRMLSWPSIGGQEMVWNVGFDIRETDDGFVFRADMPGIRESDLDITLTGNQLVVSGKREQEQEQNEGQYHTYERSFGSFTRSFALPESADVDNIRSDLKDGVLTLVVPKKAGSTQQRRKIQVGSGTKS